MSVMKKIKPGNGEVMGQERRSGKAAGTFPRREVAMRRPGMRAFQTEGTASAKARRWEGACGA